MMDKHHRLAGQLQLGVAALCIVGALAAIALFVAIGNVNWSGTSYFKGSGLMDFLGSFFGLMLIAVAVTGAVHLQLARSWLKGNANAKYPLLGIALLQLCTFILAPIALYTFWAMLRK